MQEELKELLRHVDHTLLQPACTTAQIETLCDEALRYQTATVCIPPNRVAQARAYGGAQLRICTVIGFPNGYQSAESKVLETLDALQNGADEIDMVIPIGLLKEGQDAAVEEEIRRVKQACGGRVLKVIVECCLLSDAEKIRACAIVGRAGADYIKTSTGFSTGGATFEDVALLRKHSPSHVKVKAAGGITSLEDAREFLRLGAERLGTSRIVKLVQGMERSGY